MIDSKYDWAIAAQLEKKIGMRKLNSAPRAKLSEVNF